MNLQLDSIKKNSYGQRKSHMHIGFMKCHVQKRFQNDVYVNCKPVYRSKCVPVNNFEILKNVSLKKNRNSFPTTQQKVQ